MKRSSLYFVTAVIILTLNPLSAYSSVSDNSPTSVTGYTKVDIAFGVFSSEFYKNILASKHYRKINDIRMLHDRADSLYSRGKITDATALILNNINTVKKHINSKAIINIVGLLLKANEIKSANALLNTIKIESDPSLVSNVLFLFAEYYYSRNDWEKVINLVDKIANDLPKDKYQHALFIQGISLQALHRHRKALSIYSKIPDNSTYYVESRINMAVSDFRQDWWTDAQIIIKNLLKRPDIEKNRVLADRLYTTIGYSFLQLEYFRNSREALRHVSLDSAYTNQALLGIALNAGYQKDYVGALNAAQILNRKKGIDLEVDESYLLLPYFYEKLHQNATATAGYTDAINHYKKKIHQLDEAMHNDDAVFATKLQQIHNNHFSLNGIKLDLAKTLPPSYYTQVKLLNLYSEYFKRTHPHATHLTKAYHSTLSKFTGLLKTSAIAQLNIRKTSITDYMNQCRYGLARLYDNGENKKIMQP